METVCETIVVMVKLWDDAVSWLWKLDAIDSFQKERIFSDLQKIRPLICPENLYGTLGSDLTAIARTLQLTASLLPNEPRLKAEDLTAISKEVDEFVDLVQRLELPEALRSALLEIIRLAGDAVNRYRIYGAVGLRKQFRSMLGESMLLMHDLPGYNIEQEKEITLRHALERLARSVSSGLKKVGAYKDGIDLIAGFVKALGGGNSND